MHFIRLQDILSSDTRVTSQENEHLVLSRKTFRTKLSADVYAVVFLRRILQRQRCRRQEFLSFNFPFTFFSLHVFLFLFCSQVLVVYTYAPIKSKLQHPPPSGKHQDFDYFLTFLFWAPKSLTAINTCLDEIEESKARGIAINRFGVRAAFTCLLT